VIANSIEEMETKYIDHPRTASQRVKKAPAKKGVSSKKAKEKEEKKQVKKAARKAVKKKSPLTQSLYKVSKELKEVVHEDEISRPEATKKVWDYIKKRGLQDPNNKRMINPDKNLAKVFGSKEPIDMMKMAGKLSKHLLK
jgi:DNA topoisomerase-1